MAPIEKNDVVRKESGGIKGKKVAKRPMQYTSKGRAVIIPKKILPTSSSDEKPSQKSNKSHTSVLKGIQELQALVKENPEIAAFVNSGSNVLTSQAQFKEKPRNEKEDNNVSKSASSSTSRLTEKKITSHSTNIKDPNRFTSPMEIHQRSLLENEQDPETDLTYFTLPRSSKNDSSLKNNERKESLDSQSEPEFDAENDLIPVKKSVLQKILKEICELTDAVKTIKGDIKCIKADTSITNARPLFAASEGFPLQTMEKFNLFERDSEKQKKLYSDLRKYGGTKLREALSTAFKASMTDKLTTEFTWYGDRRTENFAKSKLASLLHRVVKRCENYPGPLSETEFKTEMMEVLRAAKQRYRNAALAKNPRRGIGNVQEDDLREEENEIAGNHSDEEVEDGTEREDGQNSERFESEASGSYMGSAESDAE